MASTSVRYVKNRSFARRTMKCAEVIDLVTAKAEDIASTASCMFGAEEYGVSPGRPGKVSAHAIVYTGDRHAMRSNRVHNTLQKSIR